MQLCSMKGILSPKLSLNCGIGVFRRHLFFLFFFFCEGSPGRAGRHILFIRTEPQKTVKLSAVDKIHVYSAGV